jgi:hypothetical protein
MHCEDGPAIAWADGWALWYWHGTAVPREVIDDTWSTDDILREPNAEVRRCAIERRGWDRFVTDAGLRQIGDSVDDPGNPGCRLALFDVPAQIYGEPVNVLLATNGSVERDGTRRRYGLTTPAHIREPLAAAAWTYGMAADQYAGAEVRR